MRRTEEGEVIDPTALTKPRVFEREVYLAST